MSTIWQQNARDFASRDPEAHASANLDIACKEALRLIDQGASGDAVRVLNRAAESAARLLDRRAS